MDVLTTTAHDLQECLKNKSLTSVDLVDLYLNQIQKHNDTGLKLNAFGIRGPMHGIPIIIKDNICAPSWGMGTTCGSFALKGATAVKDASIVERLRAAGMLIIAKTNLSEWANLKQAMMVSGWSAVGGQTQTPYVRGEVTPDAIFLGHSTPCGSSSGSGAGVAAGFAPVSIGTESDGSLVQPGTRAGLYGLKGTVGSIPTDGCQASAPWVATSGALAKSVTDLANLMEIMMARRDLSGHLRPSWEGLKVGFVDPDLWQPAAFVVEPREDFKNQTYAAIESAIKKIESQGAKIKQPVHLITLVEATKDSGVKEIEELMNAPVKTLQDVIDFNIANKKLELPDHHPGQELLISATKDNMTDEDFEKSLKIGHQQARDGIDKILAEHDIDVIIGPADARIASVAAVAGYPVATVPLGYADFNGRAFGMNIIGSGGKEDKILAIMRAWEASFPEARKPPSILVDWDSHKGAYM